MGICLSKKYLGLQGEKGERGEKGEKGERGPKGEPCESEASYFPEFPSYPFPECGTCEYLDGEMVCSKIENPDRFYVLGIRSDNSYYWKEMI